MKKQLLLIVIMLLPMVARAFTGMVEIDGINYYIVTKGQIAEVISKNSGYSGEIVIPETIEYEGVTCQVTAIRSAFMGCNDLTTVSIPQSVTSIGERAFEDCI